MKVSSAIFASAVVATTTEFVSMAHSPSGLFNEPSCFTIGQVNLGGGFDALESAIVKSFANDILKPKATVKFVGEEIRGPTKRQIVEISVTINRQGGWTDTSEIDMVRCKALLNVVGTLNLYYPNGVFRPWRAFITINTNGVGASDSAQNGIYSRGLGWFLCRDYAVEKTCELPFPN
jgi:hypothetical protein